MDDTNVNVNVNDKEKCIVLFDGKKFSNEVQKLRKQIEIPDENATGAEVADFYSNLGYNDALSDVVSKAIECIVSWGELSGRDEKEFEDDE